MIVIATGSLGKTGWGVWCGVVYSVLCTPCQGGACSCPCMPPGVSGAELYLYLVIMCYLEKLFGCDRYQPLRVCAAA